MDFYSIVHVLLGSILGLTLRIFVEYKFKIKTGFYINNTSLVNFIASFLLGILVALNSMNEYILLFFYVGFLGCFSTFSSFIHQLFTLLINRQFVMLFLHYIEVLIISFLSFYLGYYTIQLLLK